MKTEAVMESDDPEQWFPNWGNSPKGENDIILGVIRKSFIILKVKIHVHVQLNSDWNSGGMDRRGMIIKCLGTTVLENRSVAHCSVIFSKTRRK